MQGLNVDLLVATETAVFPDPVEAIEPFGADQTVFLAGMPFLVGQVPGYVVVQHLERPNGEDAVGAVGVRRRQLDTLELNAAVLHDRRVDPAAVVVCGKAASAGLHDRVVHHYAQGQSLVSFIQ